MTYEEIQMCESEGILQFGLFFVFIYIYENCIIPKAPI